MDEARLNPQRVRFGIFEFDLDTTELRRDGVPVRLQSQPGQVLAVLVRHPGELVTRESLRQAVWGDGTFVDFDSGLNFCIAQIRSALGDAADSPRFVRTHPKRGYEFIAPVSAVSPIVQPVTPGPAVTRAMDGRRLSLLGTALVLTVVGVFLATRGLHPAQTTIAVARFDNETGDPALTRFVDGLTDAVVAELTAAGGTAYGVIGNAAILRASREQRDLKAIGSTLQAGYVILGQVQSDASRIRVLAHLIRLPDQKHLKVIRLDADLTDRLKAQTDLARRISEDMAARIISVSKGTF